MRYRRFGKTNLWLSVFSLGTMRYLASEEIAEQTILQAVQLGVNHFETAQAYGSSEQYLGRALKQLGQSRNPLYVTTKLVPTPNADAMERAIDQSLATLQLDAIDCLAIHGLNTQEHLEWVEKPDGCMRAIDRALADGRIRHVGFSTHAPLELILRAIATERFEFVSLHYYYFFQRHHPAIELAHQHDLGIFIISPADKGGQLFNPPAALVDVCRPYSPLELTYRFLLSDLRITTLSLGAATPDELMLPLQLADQDQPLDSAEIAALHRLQTHQDTVLGSEQCRQCYQCLPCPEQIHIPEVLRLRNLATAFDMTSYATYRYGMFENAGHWFPGNKANRCTECGDCLPRCPEQLNIPALLTNAHERLNGPPRRRLWG